MADIRPRVAVIAVHGVADQAPFSSARAIARLLQRTGYDQFVERFLSIPVAPLSPDPSIERPADDRLPAVGGEFHRHHDISGRDVSQLFITSQLRNYYRTAEKETYETIRIEGRGGPAEGERDVHVYEMLWSDLSRLGSGPLQFFGGLYQLLLHTGSIAAHTARAALCEHSDKHHWCKLSRDVNAVAYFMAVVLPFLNLAMFGAALTAILTSMTYNTERLWLPSLLTIGLPVVALVAGVALLLIGQGKPRIGLVIALLAAAVAAMAYAVLPSTAWKFCDSNAHGFVLGAIAFAVSAAVLWVYDRLIPGTRFGPVPGRVIALGIIALAWGIAAARISVLQASVATVQIGVVLLGAATVLLCLGLWWVHWRAHAALRQVKPDADDMGRAKRCIWTIRLTLALPALLFSIVTLGLWAMVLFFDPGGLKGRVVFDLIKQRPRYLDFIVQDILTTSASASFGILLIVFALSMSMLIWAVFPSVLAELLPPRPRPGETVPFPRWTGGGEWLNSGFRLARWAGHIVVYVAASTLLPAGIVFSAYLYYTDAKLPSTAMLGDPAVLVRWLGGAMLAIAGSFLTARGFLSNLGMSFRAALDLILDVDNYMRELPADNPTARIFARYASLLRFIGDERYDRIVIIAHSQGTVISADLLRYVRSAAIAAPDYEPRLHFLSDRNPALFTMGSPLRQLYGLRFPHMYGWADLLHGEMGPLPKDIADDARPNPRCLNVAQWVNVYRSGDYIGRSLWRQPTCGYLWHDKRSADPNGVRMEYCIGPGAHTHYWDKTADLVGEELARLIAGQEP